MKLDFGLIGTSALPELIMVEVAVAVHANPHALEEGAGFPVKVESSRPEDLNVPIAPDESAVGAKVRMDVLEFDLHFELSAGSREISRKQRPSLPLRSVSRPTPGELRRKRVTLSKNPAKIARHDTIVIHTS